MPNSTQLYQIEECPDLYVDACACDDQRNLVFISIWGRDTAVQELLARLTLGTAEGGLDQFHVLQDGHARPVFVNDELLQKRTTREYRATLFGSMLHVWLFDYRCTQPDQANHFAYALKQRSAPRESLWPLVKETCPLPLLDHWQQPVMQLLDQHEMLTQLPGALGPVAAWRLALRLDVLEPAIGDLIRQHQLTAQACA